MLKAIGLLAALVVVLILVNTFVIPLAAIPPRTDDPKVEQLQVAVGKKLVHAEEASPTDSGGISLETTNISLPGGEIANIAWRRQPEFEYPAPPFGNQFEIIRQKAEAGDGISALILHGMVQMC